MVSLWGSKNGKDGDNRPDSSEDTARASSSHGQSSPARMSRESLHEPNERSRLLQQQHQSPGYLSPDDPAVSPYNLWSVRALRWFEVLFLGITFLWWVLLFVSIFISPPGMHSRGSGFFDVSFTTLTIGNILVALIFFAVPSTAMGVLSMAISVMLLIDMIIILAVTRLRLEEGWVGIASVVWAALVAFYNIVANRTVKWGKAEEEERLTGRQETRRSLKEWLAVFAATFIMTLYVIITILLTATLTLRARDAGLQAPGERFLVDDSKYEVHVNCVGNATRDVNGTLLPTVILEGGYMPVEDSFEKWISSTYSNGTIGRYCYWDRPGLGWSDNAPSPHSAGMSATALTEALAIKGEEGPYLLVAAGIGGIYARLFATQNSRNIAGIMLIDALHEDYLPQVSNPGRGFVLWGRGIISPLGLDRLAGALFKGRTVADRVYGQSSYQGGKFIKAKLQENLVAASLTKSEVSIARRIQDREVPLVVVSSGAHIGRDAEWKDKQEALTHITDQLVAWEILKGGPPRGSSYEELWKTSNGREVLEKRLGQLYKAGRGASVF